MHLAHTMARSAPAHVFQIKVRIYATRQVAVASMAGIFVLSLLVGKVRSGIVEGVRRTSYDGQESTRPLVTQHT